MGEIINSCVSVVIIVMLRFHQHPEKQSRGNQLIYRLMFYVQCHLLASASKLRQCVSFQFFPQPSCFLFHSLMMPSLLCML